MGPRRAHGTPGGCVRRRAPFSAATTAAAEGIISSAADVGSIAHCGRPALLVVSGRASFEMVQKAVRAGIPIVASVSAPTTLAVDLALDANLTLAGFVRGPRLNVYAHPERLAEVSPRERPPFPPLAPCGAQEPG